MQTSQVIDRAQEHGAPGRHAGVGRYPGPQERGEPPDSPQLAPLYGTPHARPGVPG